VKAAQTAVTSLSLVALGDSNLLGTPETVETFNNFKSPTEPRYRLVSGLDSLFLLRRDLSLHIGEAQAGMDVLSQGKLANLGSLNDLSTHAIVDRGLIVGLWEYDHDVLEIAWVSFVGEPAEMLAEINLTEKFIRDELGDARSFSLDSPKSRQPSLARLRELRASLASD
jgi:hypothetical protein